MEWTREKTLILIEEYQKRRGLWDMTHEDYRKKDIKRELLAEVAEKIDTTLPNVEIEKKFHTLRTQYHREIQRMHQSSADYRSKWFAFKSLDFLSSPKACRTGKTEYSKNKTEKTTPTLEKKKSLSRYIKMEFPQEEPQASSVTTEFLTLHKKPNATQQQNKKHENESRKDLEKLIHETTTDEVNLVENHQEYKTHSKPIFINTTTNIQSLEQYFDENGDLHHDTNETPINAAIVHNSCDYPTQQPAIIRIQKRDLNALEQTASYDEEIQNQPSSKKLYYENRCSTAIGNRDEFSTYGEYVSNEMRLITSRDILVTLKHKINMALFEASMAQLQK